MCLSGVLMMCTTYSARIYKRIIDGVKYVGRASFRPLSLWEKTLHRVVITASLELIFLPARMANCEECLENFKRGFFEIMYKGYAKHEAGRFLNEVRCGPSGV